MKIHIPENISGGELRLLPEGPAQATIQDIFLGKSKTGNPKITIKWVVTSELFDGDADTSIGDNVLDIYSLTEQALWRLNQLYMDATEEPLPQGDYSEEEFLDLLKENLIGLEANLILVTDIVNDKERTKIDKVEFI